MSPATSPIPSGYHTVTPYLTVRGAKAALVFYKKAFGAVELMCLPGENDTLMHAEMKIGDSIVMLSDECLAFNSLSPQHYNGTPVGIMLYVENVDHTFPQAVEAGATAVMPPTDMFWGDRMAKVIDPFGHVWSIGTHKFDVTPEEIAQGTAEWAKKCECNCDCGSDCDCGNECDCEDKGRA